MLRKGLKLAIPTLRDLAREVGMSYASMRAYVRGARIPNPQVMRRLVASLRKRGTALGALADELEAASKRRGP
jgi:lambda repressor-like predicted transcriptional regulator